ncbi:MAG TPA: class I SAM-dependent methyltransferase [Bryobacteraceae bacterium]|jgi:SAM-dependent methyltransferase|nr:class I SAM-dependent methyltransferase [Bryobacteraceae bacterium]
MNFHAILENPSVYRASQVLLAPGMTRIVTRRLARIFEMIPRPERVLDVGCGPDSWLWKLGMKPVGLDVCHPYTTRYRAAGSDAVTASSFHLPFPDGFFDVVFSYSLLHHLPEQSARRTVEEILRVTRTKGHVILFDPVVPKIPSLRPVAWALCRLDRGRFIRCQQEYESRILKGTEWKIERFTHSYLGTEGLLSLQVKN